MPSILPQRTLRMKDQLYFKLKYIAESNARSYNQEAVLVLKYYVKYYEKRNGPIVFDDP